MLNESDVEKNYHQSQILFIFNEKANDEDNFWWSPFVDLIQSKPIWPINSSNLFNVYRYHHHQYVEGLNFRLSPSKSTILFNLIRIFMEQNNLFVDNGWIYQRDEKNNSESQIIRLENFFDFSKVLTIFLRHKFPNQINEEDLNLLMLESADECLKKMLAVPSLLPQKLNKYRKLFSLISKIKEDQFLSERLGA